MKIYDLFYNAKAPKGIKKKKVYIVGGGLAGLAAAAFLADDIHMPAKNITIYEKMNDVGGSMDGTGKAVSGYLCRGEREMEPFMECLWYLCSKAPSLRHKGRTVLDDVVDFNKDEPIHSEYRIIEKCGKVADYHNFTLDDECRTLATMLLYAPEETLEGLAIQDYFPPRFFESNMWYCFSTMLAFKKYHSIIEAKRYFRRFAHLGPEIDYLHGILHTDLNEYEAMIKPILFWLKGLGVNIITDTEVTDIELTKDNNTVISLEILKAGQKQSIKIAPEDMVFVTNGSMVTNSAFGDNNTVAPTNRDTKKRGLFTLWEKLAAKDKKFGNPATFISDINKTKWVSVFPTITDYPQFVERIEKVSGSKAGCGGAISIKDSSWLISFVLHHKPFFSNQPDNVEVLWLMGLYGENTGDYIKKPMCDCTGNEIMTEILYHLDMLDMKDDLLVHSYISTCMMPYITSQFMPRKIADRPKIVPDGCTNIAFIGQYVETPEDAVFTVETSVRTAMQAVYYLTKVDKDPIEVYPTRYDIRYILAGIKKQANVDKLTIKDLPKIDPNKIEDFQKMLVDFLNNNIEPMPSLYPGRDKKY
ncbi:MAG: oleate hydratase [Smithella sp.]